MNVVLIIVATIVVAAVLCMDWNVQTENSEEKCPQSKTMVPRSCASEEEIVTVTH